MEQKMELNSIYTGDALAVLQRLPDGCADCCITSPPYWGLRDYGVPGQLGQEATPEAFIATLLNVFREVHRVLKPAGTCFVNLGDTYAGGGAGTTKNADIAAYVQRSKHAYILPNGAARSAVFRGTARHKSLLMIPYRFAWGMVEQQGWVLRNVISWHKPNQMPSSVRDRFTVDFEPIFFFSKTQKYHFTQQLEPYAGPSGRWGGDMLKGLGSSRWSESTGQKAYRDRSFRPNPRGRNMRTTWSICTRGLKVGEHFAAYPEALAERMLLAACPEGGVVLDPFMGAGTTAVVARRLGRKYVGIELNPSYVRLANERVKGLRSIS